MINIPHSSVEMLRAFVWTMAHSRISNYIIPGLDSYLIGGLGRAGVVRMFHCTRNHHEVIIPHSHRFDFTCLVLNKQVVNEVWTRRVESTDDGDVYMATTMGFDKMGGYVRGGSEKGCWSPTFSTYRMGETYEMKSAHVHSIRFMKGSQVLFFEGPKVSDTSVILEPVVGGHHVETFKVEPWMFIRESVDSQQGDSNG